MIPSSMSWLADVVARISSFADQSASKAKLVRWLQAHVEWVLFVATSLHPSESQSLCLSVALELDLNSDSDSDSNSKSEIDC